MPKRGPELPSHVALQFDRQILPSHVGPAVTLQSGHQASREESARLPVAVGILAGCRSAQICDPTRFKQHVNALSGERLRQEGNKQADYQPRFDHSGMFHFALSLFS